MAKRYAWLTRAAKRAAEINACEKAGGHQWKRDGFDYFDAEPRKRPAWKCKRCGLGKS